MTIELDTVKREKTLLERGLDFADSAKVFAGLHFVARDDVLIMVRNVLLPSGYWMAG